MKLAIFNGSPRNRNSNSKLLTDHFLMGFASVRKDEVPVCFLANVRQMSKHLEIWREADTVILIFPLYTSSMPAIVKLFFEQIYLEKCSDKKIGFIVQSGFPEIIHSVWIERYLDKLVRRLGGEYLGTVIKGGVEGIQVQPPIMTRKIFRNFFELGACLATTGRFSYDIVKSMHKPYQLSKVTLWVVNIMNCLGWSNFYWNMNLKKNGAYKKRFDKPYQFPNR